MRILFFGYGEVGRVCLQALISAGIEITGVVTRSSDNGTNFSQNSVFHFAKDAGIEILNHTSVRAKTLPEALNNVEYIISVQYDRILDETWLCIPKCDTLNLHFSFLPRLRGCFPTKWAIIEEQTTGVTLHSVDKGIDTGDILDQQALKIAINETDKSLYEKLSSSAIKLFKKNIPNLIIKSFPNRRKQCNEHSSYHPKKLPFGGRLDLRNDLDFCDRFLRAFTYPPFPPASCILGGNEVGLFPPVCKEKKSRTTEPGNFYIAEGKLLAVECLDGILFFDTLSIDNEQISPTIFWNTKKA